MKMDCVEIKVATATDPGDVVGRMREEEPLGVWQDENTLHLFWPEEKWYPAILSDSRPVIAELDPATDLEALSMITRADPDWNAAWPASLQQVRICHRTGTTRDPPRRFC